MKREVIVADYGSGNLQSIMNALSVCGGAPILTSDPEKIRRARHLIIPGVGAFGDCIRKFREQGLIEPVEQAIASGAWTFGICVGLQILFDESEEFGASKGLGLIKGRVVRIPAADRNGERLKVPNVGWRPLISPTPGGFSNGVFTNTSQGSQCYFVHSYMVKPEDEAKRTAIIAYGAEWICAAAQQDNLIGTQFHPEKSGSVGLAIMKTFISL